MTVILATGLAISLAAAEPSAEEIVNRSVANNERNWVVAPQYTHFERDVVSTDHKTVRCYEDLMIDGWPYQRLIAKNDQPLPAAQAHVEEQKLIREAVHRRQESATERDRHIQRYRQQRRQDHELMQQMIKAFDFKLLGHETVNGRRCYVLEGTPRPDYRPVNRDTEVLKGMRGKLWVDMEQFQWVKVHAEVFRPVAFGLFIARVKPGTQITLEQGPVGGGIWLPTRFEQNVKSTVLVLWPHNRGELDRYWGYRTSNETQTAGR